LKEIFIITSYFPPETGAASNRIYHVAGGLQKKNFNVSVITPLPNYPTGQIFSGFKGKFKMSTNEKGIHVHRLWIYASNSKNKFLRLLAMLSYSFSLIWFFMWNKIPQQVIVQSPPLLVAFTSMFFLRSRNRKLILNVSDLWPIAGLELGAFKRNSSYRILEKIERFNYKTADLVMGQSEEILNHISSICPNKKTFLYRNYPGFELSKLNIETPESTNKIKLVYAGLLGIAQGVFKLCQSLDYNGYEFHIYGTGAERKNIQEFITARPELPIYYHGEITRDALHPILLTYDLAIIPLSNRIYGSVPSKIFEYAKLGVPMLYFGGGEGEMIVENYQLGWIARAGDYTHLNEVISSFKKTEFSKEKREQIRKTAVDNFNFELQLEQLVHLL